MMAPILAALLFTSTFFVLMWTYDILTSYFYYFLRERELRAYEKFIARTQELLEEERAHQEQIKQLIQQYDATLDEFIKKRNEQAK